MASNTIDSSHFVKGRPKVRSIPVHRGERVYEAHVDDEDYEFLDQHRWSATVRKTTTYANTTIPTEAGFKCVSMHRMVIGDAEEDWDTTLGGLAIGGAIRKRKNCLHSSSEVSSL